MATDYDGVKYYSPGDWSIGLNYKKATRILDSIDDQQLSDINEIIELYNVQQIILLSDIKPEFTQPYVEKARKTMGIVAKFFKAINDKSMETEFCKVCIDYQRDFWALFDKFSVYDQISPATFQAILYDPETRLVYILEHRKTVEHYDRILSDFMRQSDQVARILVSQFLEKKPPASDIHYYMPPSLEPGEYEGIITRSMIDSDCTTVGVLQLIANSLTINGLPISDSLRLKAERKIKEILKSRANDAVVTSYGMQVSFADVPEVVSCDMLRPLEYHVTYDVKWIKDNLDYPTLWNNFIHLFRYVDLCYRSTFVQTESSLNVFEKAFGLQGVREYKTGAAFQMAHYKSSIQLREYSRILSEYDIRIEDMVQWFFAEYLKNEFHIEDFIVNMPSKESTILEKIRTLVAEMDSILKQYSMYVTDHGIDRELFEISSKPVSFPGIPSQIEKKYAYNNSADIEKEQFFLFSDQCLLHYLPQHEKARSFYELIRKNNVKLTEYHDFERNQLMWLKSRNTILIDDEGFIQLNKPKAYLLKDLYEHEVVCVSYYKDKNLIEQLVTSGDLRYSSSLFSVPEQNYLNYVLNRSEYDNGQDLRNRYVHGRNTLIQTKHESDYIWLLKIMILIVLKINEECCLINPE